MAQDPPLCLAKLAGQYWLKTADADRAAKKLGLNLRRGAAKLAPWQEELLRPELSRMKLERDERRWLEATHEHTGYLDEAGRMGFTNIEMARQLAPILKRMRDEENTG